MIRKSSSPLFPKPQISGEARQTHEYLSFLSIFPRLTLNLEILLWTWRPAQGKQTKWTTAYVLRNSILKRSQLEASVTESSLPRGQLAKQLTGKQKRAWRRDCDNFSSWTLRVVISGCLGKSNTRRVLPREHGSSTVLSASTLIVELTPLLGGLIASTVYHFFYRSQLPWWLSW